MQIHSQFIIDHITPYSSTEPFSTPLSGKKERLVWAEVDLRKFRKNYLHIKRVINPRTKVMAVVKANAYGHGIVRIGQELEELGADYLAAVCVYEGRQLREAGVRLPILLTGYTDKESIAQALDYDLTISVIDETILRAVSKEATKRNITAKIHVHVDTGLHMDGVPYKDAVALIMKTQEYPNIFLEGIFSHFANADDPDTSYAHQQLAAFTSVVEEIQQKGITPPLIHMAASDAIVRMPEAHFTMVRPGALLYGPTEGPYIPYLTGEPILTLKTIVTRVHELQPGESAGYGQSFIAKDKRLIATIPVGFGDGFRRAPANWPYVLVNGEKAPIVATIAMDKTTIDVTNIPNVKSGDEVVLIGKQKNALINTWDIVQKPYGRNFEVLALLTERVSRVYKG